MDPKQKRTCKTEVSYPNLDGSGMTFHDFCDFGYFGRKLCAWDRQNVCMGKRYFVEAPV